MKYQTGDRVTYRHTGATGVVQNCLNQDDLEDLRLQGPRYEVYFSRSGWLYSILESELALKERAAAGDSEPGN